MAQKSDGTDVESLSSEQKAVRIALMAPVKEEWVRGEPGPLGLLCFGMTMCMLMWVYNKWAEGTFVPTVICYALFYGGFGEFVVGTLELIKGNTFGGTVFASYGTFWMGLWLMTWMSLMHPGQFPAAPTGMTLWFGLWTILSAGFLLVALRKNGCLITIFGTLIVTLILLAGGQWEPKCVQAAGYIGLVCGGSGIYAAFAFLYKIELGYTLPGVTAVAYI